MASVNKVMLLGHLGQDPETRHTQDGRLIVNLRMATSESWKDKATGERREKTEWHTVVIFNEGLGKVASQYLHIGSRVYIEGQLQTRRWQDKDGNDRYATEVVLQNYRGELVLLDAAKREEETAAPASPARVARPSLSEQLNDEIPI